MLPRVPPSQDAPTATGGCSFSTIRIGACTVLPFLALPGPAVNLVPCSAPDQPSRRHASLSLQVYPQLTRVTVIFITAQPSTAADIQPHSLRDTMYTPDAFRPAKLSRWQACQVGQTYALWFHRGGTLTPPLLLPRRSILRPREVLLLLPRVAPPRGTLTPLCRLPSRGTLTPLCLTPSQQSLFFFFFFFFIAPRP